MVGKEENEEEEREDRGLEQAATGGIQTVPPDYILIPFLIHVLSRVECPGNFFEREEKKKKKLRIPTQQRKSNIITTKHNTNNCNSQTSLFLAMVDGEG